MRGVLRLLRTWIGRLFTVPAVVAAWIAFTVVVAGVAVYTAVLEPPLIRHRRRRLEARLLEQPQLLLAADVEDLLLPPQLLEELRRHAAIAPHPADPRPPLGRR
jgi:hypothetical protein